MPLPNKPFCLPVAFPLTEQPEKCGIGCGFFISSQSGATYLVTTAHTSTMDNEFRDFSRWADRMFLCSDDKYPLPLFYTSSNIRLPTFLYHFTNKTMADIIAIKVDITLLPFLKNFHIFNLTKHVSTADKGDTVASYGFPNIKKQWPYWPPNKMCGSYVARQPNGGSHLMNIKMITGHSGGPVLDMDGTLLGMGLGQISNDGNDSEEQEYDIAMSTEIISMIVN